MESTVIRRYIIPSVFAWLAMIGVDFLLHAGILAGLYLEPSPFLLPAETSFARIPLGYLSFLLVAFLLVWLLTKLKIGDWSQAGWFALRLGGLIWLSMALGLYSISTISPALLLGWTVGQTVESGVGGVVAGVAISTRRRGRLLIAVIAFDIAVFALVIVLQSFGLVPSISNPHLPAACNPRLWLAPS